MHIISRVALLASLAVFTVASPAVAQTTIGSATNDYNAGPFGRDSKNPPVFGAFAETFVTPLGTPVLTGFSFWLQNYDGGANLQLVGSVFAWGGSATTGVTLFTGTASGSSNSEAFEERMFAVPNLLLSPGTTYAFLLRVGDGSPDASTNFFGTQGTDTYASGSLYYSFQSTASALGQTGAFVQSNANAVLDNNSWGADAAFTARFIAAPTTAVPEPGSVVLVAAGLAGVLMIARRRRVNA
jgi:hypothetical protein